MSIMVYIVFKDFGGLTDCKIYTGFLGVNL